MEKRKILVVEDDPQVLAMLGEALDLMGVQPHCLASSREAAELIQKEKFDGVFLDWLMPELNGLELAKRIRASEPNARCPIFMLTGNDKRLALKESFDVGINLFLQKPISLEHIRQLVNVSRDTALEKQRHHSRVPLEVPVVCKWEHRQAQGQSINLSPTGLLVEMEQAPPPGARVHLELGLPGESQPLAVTAEVTRINADGRQTGFQFIEGGYEEWQRLKNLVEQEQTALRCE